MVTESIVLLQANPSLGSEKTVVVVDGGGCLGTE